MKRTVIAILVGVNLRNDKSSGAVSAGSHLGVEGRVGKAASTSEPFESRGSTTYSRPVSSYEKITRDIRWRRPTMTFRFKS